MGFDLRLGPIRSDQMKKDPPRSESDPLKVHISEIITALVFSHITLLQPVHTSSKPFKDLCPIVSHIICNFDSKQSFAVLDGRM